MTTRICNLLPTWLNSYKTDKQKKIKDQKGCKKDLHFLVTTCNPLPDKVITPEINSNVFFISKEQKFIQFQDLSLIFDLLLASIPCRITEI